MNKFFEGLFFLQGPLFFLLLLLTLKNKSLIIYYLNHILQQIIVKMDIILKILRWKNRKLKCILRHYR